MDKAHKLSDELQSAIKSGALSKVKKLLDTEDLESTDALDRTALHFAAHAGKAKIVTHLIRSGSNMSAPDYRGNTALHLAANGAHADVVTLLLEAGAPVDASTALGELPLHSAAAEEKNFAKRTSIAKALLDAGSSIDHTNKTGQTALHIAAMHGNIELVELLLDHGAATDISAVGQLGTPKDTAETFGHPNVAKLIASR